MADTLGRFLWFDLFTKDIQGAIGFYQAVVGWSVETFDMGGQPYPMWKTPQGENVGGVMPLSPQAAAMGAPPHWMPYIGAPSADAIVDKVKATGGTVYVPATDIPTVGRFAVLSDPERGVFGVLTPAYDPELEHAAEPGEISWNEIGAGNLGTLWAWYTALFGWTTLADTQMPGVGPYKVFGRPGGIPLGGFYTRPAAPPMPTAWIPYFRVPDIATSMAVAQSRGGRAFMGPILMPDGDKVAVMADAQGAVFGLHQKT